MPARHSEIPGQEEIIPPFGKLFKLLVSRGRLDVIIALLFFLSSFVFGIQDLRREGWGTFYQEEYTPALVFACTGKFEPLLYTIDVAAKPELAAVTDFMTGKTQSFDCKDLPPSPADRIRFVGLQYQMLYMLVAAGGIWAITGVKWSALYLLGALLAGAVSVAIYGICRLFVRPPWAAAATVLAILSPMNAVMLRELRDYSKAPFILGVILLSGWLIKSVGRSKQFVAAAALAGIVAGIGFGVRTDLAITLPFFSAALLLTLIATRFRIYRDVCIAAIVFFVAFTAAAFPILSTYRGGGPIGHVALLGLTTPFNEPLGLTTPVYDVGHLYRGGDELIDQFTEEFAIGRESQPGVRPNLTPPEDPAYASSSLQALIGFALRFPADMVIRAYSAALRTISLNLSEVRSTRIPNLIYIIRSALIWQNVALPLFFLFTAYVAWSNISLAAFLILAFAYFAGLGALQFSYRHVFYLEFLYWLSFFGLIACCLQIVRFGLRNRCNYLSHVSSRKVFAALAVPFVAVVTAAVTLMLLRAFQDANVHKLVDQYLTAPRQPVQLVEERTGDNVLLRPTGEVPGMSGVTADIEHTPFEGYYLDATIDMERCPLFNAKITYKPAIYNSDFSRTIRLVSGKPGIGHIMFPVMNWPVLQLVFDGINISAQQRPCFLGLKAVVGYKTLPLPLWLQLPPDWHDMKLYQSQAESPLLLSHESKLITNFPAVPIPTSEWRNLAIHAFGEKAWDEIYAPATAIGNGVRIDGAPQTRAAYAARSVRYRLPEHTIVAARGRLKRGGAVIGIMNADGTRWETTLIIPVGDFVALLEVPQAGEYRVMIANDLPGPENYSDIAIYDIGLFGKDPSELRVKE